MPKATRLIDALRAEPVAVKAGPDSWAEKLRVTNPALMAEVDETIDAWNANDAGLLAVYPTKHAIAVRLIKAIGGTVVTRPDTVARYIRARAERGTQG